MSTIKFFLLGKLRIETDAKVIQKIESHKAEELLVYLLLNRDQSQPREKIADKLWGEIALQQSKTYLRKALWQLQSILESCGERILLIDDAWLQVNPQFDFWLDIEVLEKAFKSTQGISGRDLQEEQAESVLDAVELYRGELLEGWYLDWCLYERERLQHLYLAMLDKMMDYHGAQGDYETSLIFGEMILHRDRAHERTHRHLMRLYYLAGDRTAALRQYQKCVAVLKEELDVEPANRTHLLFEMIRADKLEAPPQPDHIVKVKPEEQLNLLFLHLNILHRSLSQIQIQITQDIEIIQKTIKENQS